MIRKPRIEIKYCTQCNWMLRAAWLAQELLTTFTDILGEVALIPGTGGVFEVRVDETLVWSRKTEGRFPEAKELKQRVRDVVAPEKYLGHSDVKEKDS
ncbi:MAG: SelT/SelW/SelH family protein [Pseudomonadota bacterium]